MEKSEYAQVLLKRWSIIKDRDYLKAKFGEDDLKLAYRNITAFRELSSKGLLSDNPSVGSCFHSSEVN